MYYKIINNIKWYYRLKPNTEGNKIKKGLFSDTPRNTLTNKLLVALSYFDHSTQKDYLLYTYFKSYVEYGIYCLKLPQNQRCFYEIVLGESNQKPYFDIDITTNNGDIIDGELVKDNLIYNIVKILAAKNITVSLSKDILVYTSHGTSNGKRKQSYHIIVNNYCHCNNVEARAFYDTLMDNVKPEYVQWIDYAVYSPTQQFRIVGSQKLITDGKPSRIKTFQKTWLYNYELEPNQRTEITSEYPELPDSPEHEFMMQLEASIIGFTGNCKFLPPFELKPERIKSYTETEDISINDAKEAIELIGLAGKISVTDSRFPYKFLGISGPIVMLKRTKPSRCKICERVHDNENPYLVVVGDEKSVYFHCRRAPDNKKLFLGKLSPTSLDIPDIKEDIKEDTVNESVKITWSKHVIDRVQQMANQGKEVKKYITPETEINSDHKKQLIEMYIKYQ